MLKATLTYFTMAVSYTCKMFMKLTPESHSLLVKLLSNQELLDLLLEKHSSLFYLSVSNEKKSFVAVICE